jgi:hypothetical protein
MSEEQRAPCAGRPRSQVLLAALGACVLLAWALLDPSLFSSPRSADGAQSARETGGMSCGGAELCGVLALETGLGEGNYRHDTPSVHGLWPEVPPYGNSACIAPASHAPPKPGLPSCYNNPAANPDHQSWFVEHEWSKHGVCAGAGSEDDYFAQICAISSGPLRAMATARKAGGDLYDLVRAVHDAGYPIFNIDRHDSQIMLSACARRDSRRSNAFIWQLAKVTDFATACGDGRGVAPSPTPVPSARCILYQRGPPCASDGDCLAVDGCLRCARSGFCTNNP